MELVHVRCHSAQPVVPKHVLKNLAPARAPGKALALRRAARQLGCRHALFVGDDAGDEEAFAIPGLAVLGVRVGARGKTRAVQRLADQRGVDGLLRALLQGRGR